MAIVEQLSTTKGLTVIPGAYSDPTTGGPTGAAVDSGILALVSGSYFSRLKPNTPTVVTSDAALKRMLPYFGKRFAKAIFAPCPANERAVGRPASVLLVNAAPSLRAERTFTNATPVNCLTIKSRIWGADGNKIGIKLENGTDKGKKLTVYYETNSWSVDNIGGDNIFSLEYTETEASTMLATVNPASGVTIAYTKTGALLAAGPVDSYAPDNMAFDGTITVTLDQNPGTGVTVEVTVTGTNKSTGAALVEVLSFIGDSGVYTKTTSGSFSAVTTIARTNSAGGWGTATTAALAGNAFNLPVADYDTVRDVVDRVNVYAAAGFVAADLYGDGATRLIAEMDLTSSQDITSAVNFKADLDFLVKTIGNDEADTPVEPLFPGGLIIAERPAAGVTVPSNVTTTAYLLAGADGVATSTAGGSWELALQSLRNYPVNEGWIDVAYGESDAVAIWALVRSEVDYRHGLGRSECHFHFATAKQATKATIKAAIISVNRDHTNVWVDETKFINELGNVEWFLPKFTALRMAAAAAGRSSLVMPLTKKKVDVIDVRGFGSDWTYEADAEELVAASACMLRPAETGIGFEVVRWVSTYRDAADPLRTESSTVRSMNASTQDMRNFLVYVVGQPNYDGTAAALKGAAIGRLARQRDEFRYIKSFNPSNIALTDAGATLTLDATNINPVEGVNFAYYRPEYSRTVTIL